MLIVTEHHRDAKEGKRRARYSLECKSESTDQHMLNVGKHIWFLLGLPKSVLIHEFIHTIRILLSVFHLPTFKEKKKPGVRGSVGEYPGLKCGRNIFSTASLLWHCWRCNFASKEIGAGEQMSLEPPTESDIGQGGIRGWPLCWGKDWEQNRTRGAEWHPTKQRVTAGAPNTRPDPDRS